MGTKTIGGKIVLEGEAAYRNALKNIKTEQSQLRSEMKLCQTSFSGQQNSLDALRSKYEILTKQVETQTKKAEVYQQALENSAKKEELAANNIANYKADLEKAEKQMDEVKKASGETSAEFQEQAKKVEDLRKNLSLAEENYDRASRKTIDYKTALNYAQAELQNMQNELEQTGRYMKEAEESTDGCAISLDECGKAARESSDDIVKYGDVLKANLSSEMIMAGLAAVGDLFKYITEETFNAAKAVTEYADNIATMSVQTGVAIDTLQALTYAEELMDVSLDTVTAAMSRNIRSMSSAQEGTKSYVDAYKLLGVEIQDVSTGQLRDSEVVFWETVDALSAVENATQRDAVAMDLFGKSAQDLNPLIQLGSEGFKKFEQEAKNAGYVLEGKTFDALLETSDAMERLSKRSEALKNRLGAELAPEITELSETIMNALDESEDEIIDFAENGIELLTNGIEWIIEHSDIVIAGITGIATATAYHATLGPLIETVTTAWKAYKTSTDNATISHWLFSAAVNATPVGMLVTGIVGLTAAVTGLAIAQGDIVNKMDEVTQETYEQIEAAQKLNEEYATATEERATAKTEMETEHATCKKLADELVNLQQKTTLTADEQIRQRMIVEELNAVMPELNLAIDDQTGKLNLSTEALYDNINALLKMDKANAAREDMKDIAEEQWEAEKKLAELEEQLVKQKEVVREEQEKYNKALQETTDIYNGQSKIVDTEDTLRQSLTIAESGQKQLEEQITATKGSISDMEDEYASCMEFISDTDSLVTATTATEGLGNAAQLSGEQLSGMSEAAQEAFAEMQESVSQSIQTQMSIFDEFNGKAELSTTQLLANMQSQVNGVEEWATNLETLATRGIDQGLMQKLAEMGPEGAGYVATFASMTDEELKKANELWANSLTVPDTATEKIMNAYLQTGTQAPTSMAKGMTETTSTVTTASEDLATEAVDSLETTLGIEGETSKVTEEIGEKSGESVGTGITKSESEVITATENLAGEVITTATEQLSIKNFEPIGKQITQGLVKGINAGKEALLKTVSQMCTDVKSTIQKGMGADEDKQSDINSVIANSFPENMRESMSYRMVNDGLPNKEYSINQNINIYSPTDDLVETSRKFKQAQREAAEEW